MKTQLIKRREFVSRFMRDCGVTYVQACRIYDTMVAVVEDGVCAGAAIRFGKVGVIHPVRKPSRTVAQNCRITKGRKVVQTQHIYNLGPRVIFKFRLFKQFMASHSVNWFDEREFHEM